WASRTSSAFTAWRSSATAWAARRARTRSPWTSRGPGTRGLWLPASRTTWSTSSGAETPLARSALPTKVTKRPRDKDIKILCVLVSLSLLLVERSKPEEEGAGLSPELDPSLPAFAGRHQPVPLDLLPGGAARLLEEAVEPERGEGRVVLRLLLGRELADALQDALELRRRGERFELVGVRQRSAPRVERGVLLGQARREREAHEQTREVAPPRDVAHAREHVDEVDPEVEEEHDVRGRVEQEEAQEHGEESARVAHGERGQHAEDGARRAQRDVARARDARRVREDRVHREAREPRREEHDQEAARAEAILQRGARRHEQEEVAHGVDVEERAAAGLGVDEHRRERAPPGIPCEEAVRRVAQLLLQTARARDPRHGIEEEERHDQRREAVRLGHVALRDDVAAPAQDEREAHEAGPSNGQELHAAARGGWPHHGCACRKGGGPLGASGRA